MGKLKIKSGFTLKRIDLAVKGLVDTKFIGSHGSVFKGNGLEFAEYREYNPGSDDASRIDWKASRRVGQTIVKEFVEERNLEIIFLVDVSSHMLTGSTKKLKAEYNAEFISTLSQSFLNAGDSVGFVLFSDSVVAEAFPEQGMQAHYSLTKNLIDISNYSGYSDIEGALDYVYKKGNEGSLVILISDFVYGLPSEKTFKLASKKFDLINVIVRDPRDLSLPSGTGQVVLEDPYSGSTMLVDPNKVGKSYSRLVKQDLHKLKSMIKRFGADYLYLETSKPFLKELIKFYEIRASKWR